MSRLILIVVFLSTSLILSGCASDDYRRDTYAERGGSFKDTHLRKKKSYRKASRRYLKKYAKRRGHVRKNKRVAKIRRPQNNQYNQYNQYKKSSGTSKASRKEIVEKEANKKIVKKAETQKPDLQAFKKQKNLPQKDGGATSDEAAKQDLAVADKPETQQENPEEIKPSRPVKVEKPKEIASGEKSGAARSEKNNRSDLPKEPVIVADRGGKPITRDEVEHQPLTMHLGVPRPDLEKNKKRAFNADITAEGAQPYSIVKVYYATDRGLSGQRQPKLMFGGKRGPISYGSAEVSIPKSHKIGEIETPSIWRMEFRENAKKHVILKKVQRRSKTRFFEEIKSNIKLSKGKNAFVFVHGYNIEFHEAALRTAQMAHDLKFDGVPLFYSWPSQGTYEGYTRDEANVQWTQANLKRFMKDFVNRSDAENIYLIAHSMGARALTGAVAQLVDEMPSVKNRIKEVMLAAPDIDAEIFKRDIAPKLVKAARNVTLYASADDRALKASKTLHGEPRAGDAGDSLVVYNGIDTIDATGIDTSLFGHAYFAEAPTIISDILAIIHYHRRPKDRPGLIPVLASEGQYWAFRKNRPVIYNGTTIIENIIKEQNH